MASKQISPAAELLRHSKLFSVPDPIRKPSIDVRGAIARYESDSATQHYPTKAAIMTTNIGRKRGDWGMKRNLPLRKTQRPNPIIHVKAVDSADHITEWEQGTPHSIALRKFQEINVPVMHNEFAKTRALAAQAGKNRSVFDVFEPSRPLQSTLEPSSDSAGSILSPRTSQTARKASERWKFKGPWLAGMEEHEFERYLEKRVKPNRSEFKAYLESWMLQNKVDKTKAEQLAQGQDFKDPDVTLTEQEYELELVRLRSEGRQLYSLMWDFLDLPGRSPDEQNDQSIGPPATHPSGGLSYLRTGNILQNHPAIGPVAEHQPVQARMIAHAKAAHGKGNATGASVGIAGFVSESNGGGSLFRGNDAVPGDTKMHVVPKHATIDARGRTRIDYSKASSDSVAIWDLVYDKEEHAQKVATQTLADRQGALGKSSFRSLF